MIDRVQQHLGFSESKFNTWLNFYSKKTGIEVIFDDELDAAAAINTSDLSNPKVYFNPEFVKEKYNLEEEQLFFVLFHELEHLKEDIQLRSTDSGEKLYNERNEKLKKAGNLAESMHTLENFFRDVFVNNEVIHPKNAPVLKAAKNSIYRDHLFKGSDYLNSPVYNEKGKLVKKIALPKHFQFLYTILRESMLPEEKCNIDPQVRNIIKRLEFNGSLKEATEGTTSHRLKSLWENIEPVYMRLVDGDIQEEKKKRLKNGDWNPFQEFYENIPELPHTIGDSIGEEELDQSVQKVSDHKKQKNKQKTKEELELEKRVRNMGVDTEDAQEFEKTKKALKKYTKFLSMIEEIKDEDSGEKVLDEIENLFTKIRARRTKPKYRSKGSVDIERGVRLDSTSIASGIADIKGGNMNPEMFEKDEIHEKEKTFVGRFDLTLVADGSGSMKDYGKNEQQKIAVLLILEALKRLHDKLDEASYDLLSGLEFNTESIMFTGRNVSLIKKEGKDFSDIERLNAFSKLDYDNGGSTNDYDGLDYIVKEIEKKGDQYIKELESGKTKKIVFVTTDGESSSTSKLQKNIHTLRKIGVSVYGIGITNEGKPVIGSYSGDNDELGFGQVCENPESLAKVIKDLLSEHLENI